MEPFRKVYITHRGFFNNIDIPENSLPAFKKTVKYHYGTELDVQLTKDGKLVVFHDESLLRMCGVDKKLTDCTYEELLKLNLLDTDIKIPLFKDVLDVLTPTTPLIVEIKPEGDYIKTTDEAIKLLNSYDRLWTMESFNPFVVYHLKKNYPHIIRGQLSENYFQNKNSKLSFLLKLILSNYLHNFIVKPDYCAYDIKAMKNISFRLISVLFKGECVAWTVKSENDLSNANKYYQQIIFDSFIPKEK